MEDQQVSEPETCSPFPHSFNHQESESLVTERSTKVITQESGLRITQASVISESGRVESNMDFSSCHSTQAEHSSSSYSSSQTTTHHATLTSSQEIPDVETAVECQVVAESETVVNQQMTTISTQKESLTLTSSQESTNPVSLTSEELLVPPALPEETQPPKNEEFTQEGLSTSTTQLEVQENTSPAAMDCAELDGIHPIPVPTATDTTDIVPGLKPSSMDTSPEGKEDVIVPILTNDGEIAQEKIKNALHEIISEIDKEVEEDFQNDEATQEADEAALIKQAGELAQKKRTPPPVLPKRVRPVSMPGFPTFDDDTQLSPDSGKPITLQKLLTPAMDSSGELTPRTRKRRMFASSSFYSPLHPTMEEQVDLARQISQSLSSENNTQSKGQSMYVKRRNRSLKWIHESEGGETIRTEETSHVEESSSREPLLSFKIPHVGLQEVKFREKSPLKLVMNPRGQVIDFNTLRNSGFLDELVASPASPEICSSLVKDLHTPKGKGAALFAKRKEKSEKWVIDGSNMKTVEPAAPQQVAPPTANPTTVTNNARAEQLQTMKEIKERMNAPRVKLIKSPWDAALEDGTVDGAFEDVRPCLLAKTLQTVIPPTQEAEPSASPAATWLQTTQLVNPNLKPLEIKPKMVPFRPVSMIATPYPKPSPARQAQPPIQVTANPTKPAASNKDPYKSQPAQGWTQSPAEMTELAEFEEIVAALTNECPEQAPTSEQLPIAANLKHVEEQPKPVLVAATPPEFAQVQLRAVAPAEVPAVQVTCSVAPVTEWLPPPSLDSRPNLQALLEKEFLPQPAGANIAAPEESSLPTTSPALQALLEREVRPRVKETTPDHGLPNTSPALQALLEREVRPRVKETTPDHVRLAREAELVKLSVRRKVQRFEAAGGSPTVIAQATPIMTRRGMSPALIQQKPASEPQPIKPHPSHPSPAVILKPATPPEFLTTDPALLPVLNGPEDAIISRQHYSSYSVQETHQTMIQTTQTIQNQASLVKMAPKAQKVVKPSPDPAPSHVFSSPVMRRASPANLAPYSGNCKGPSLVDNASKRKSLADFANYNTAPRGWNMAQDFYRPVTFRVN